MKTTAAARRYAKAVFSLAQEDDEVAGIRGELALIGEMIETSKELEDVLLTPLHPVEERKRVLAALILHAGVGATVRKFMAFVVDQRRLVDFEGIRGEYDRLADELSGLVTAEVVSASALSTDREERLRRALCLATGFDVRLEVQIDPELLGGAVAKVGDRVFDGTLRTQLDQLRTSVTKES
ncbi:MAG: ATP synthase F1 subunit delta [Myxococcota bacterium]|jgi:F-type H+-transporting ATPase subunit delta